MNSLFWAAYARCYDAMWDNPFASEVSARIEPWLPRTRPVLDVGAGTGLIAKRLVAHGFTVVATEPQPHMRKRLCARVPEVEVGPEACEELTPSDRARSIVAVNVVHMTRDPESVIAALSMAAGPGGVVVVVAPHPSATLHSVSMALLAAGTSQTAVARFVALHALLAPLTVASQTGLRPLPAQWFAAPPNTWRTFEGFRR